MKKVFFLYVIVPMLLTAITLSAMAEGKPSIVSVAQVAKDKKGAVVQAIQTYCTHQSGIYSTRQGAEDHLTIWKTAHKTDVFVDIDWVEFNDLNPCAPGSCGYIGYVTYYSSGACLTGDYLKGDIEVKRPELKLQ